MKNAIKFIGSVSLLAMISAQAMAGETLEIRNFIGTIDVVTGDYDKITITDADGAHVSTSTGHTLVDDGRKINNANCRSTKSSVKIGIGKWSWNKRTGYKDLDEYPKLLIKAPDFTHVIIKDSILFGNIDDVAS
ncbi:MAG TPA: hypothetical protein ENJ42_01615, partial [Hellea balneolensis]|nr:hypothetical protein [Hellea balneolensis]